MDRLKIFFLAKDNRGGMDTLLKQMRLLDNKKFVKSFYLFRKEDNVVYGKNDFFLNEKYPIQLQFTFGKLFLFFSNLKKTYKAIKSQNPEILFTCDVYSFIVVSLIKLISRNWCLIHLFNNNFYRIIMERPGKIYAKTILKSFKVLSRVCDLMIFTSSGLKKFTYGKMLDKSVITKIIPNSVDISKINELILKPLSIQEKKYFTHRHKCRVFSVGRLDEQKDFKTVLRTFKLIVERLPNSQLFIIGEGSLREDLKRLSIELGISQKTYFLGWKSNVYKYLKYADVFLFSSFYEGFAQVIVETMACGVPVVATDSPFGPKEILQNGKYGIIVPVGDYKGLSEGALKILSDESLGDYYAKEGFRRAQDFETKNMLRGYEQLFINIAESNVL